MHLLLTWRGGRISDWGFRLLPIPIQDILESIGNLKIMKNIVIELNQIVEAYAQKFSQIPEADFSAKPNPTKWSPKEVVGHLIDSAQNNLRRFIVGQYEPQPNIVYDQDFWVKSNEYRDAPKENVIQLWKLMNLQICSVLSTMPRENYSRLCNTGRETPNLRTLEWLAADYVKHLKHHINQVIAGSFDVVYP
jgi:DinB superfamily